MLLPKAITYFKRKRLRGRRSHLWTWTRRHHTENLIKTSIQKSIVTATVSVAELLGSETMLYATIGGHELIAKVGVNTTYKPDQKVDLAFNINGFTQ